VFAARWIIPVSAPPINGGWIRVIDGRIAEVRGDDPPPEAEQLGDVAILPRLVNAHTHLEFSGLRQAVGEPGISLADWIGLVIATRVATGAADRDQAIERGLSELWRSGTVLAGEITTPPCHYPRGPNQPELVTFAEVVGLSDDRAGERLDSAAAHLSGDGPGAAISPHAPYSVSTETIDRAAHLARRAGSAIAMHVAESPEERELLTTGTGPLAAALRHLGVWREGLFPWGADPFVDLIDRLVIAPSLLVVHGNNLNDREIEHLSRYRHASVVFCPRTHHFFRFPKHPVAQMLASGVRVALGTDSRASNPDLDLWREVQFLMNHRTDLDPGHVIRMATRNGAESLGREDLGALEPGCIAALGCVRTEASNSEQLFRDFASRPYELIES
jgi:cytosine/adenosine deaminase-related metal-dependent hydrolase